MFLLYSLFIVLSLRAISAEFKAEPTCSRFHYEEQTLEKLIRLQIFVEKMKEEIDQSRTEVKNTLEKLQEERNNIDHYKDETNALKEIVDRELERIKVDFNETMKMKETINEQLNQVETDLKKELKKVEQVNAKVVFSVKNVPTNEQKLIRNKPIKFSLVNLDTENSYNSTSGVFTVPIAGHYMMSTLLCLRSETAAYFSIVSNNISAVGAYFGDQKHAKCHTLQTIVSVSVGDELSVMCRGACFKGDKLWEYLPYAVNHFTGYLIQT